jgi:predicted amidohydrolase YtcJ
MAEMAMQLDVSPETVSSLDEMKRKIKGETEKVLEGHWIRAAGFDDTKLKGGLLTRWELDDVAPRHPVFVTHVSAHWGVTNSKGLTLGGIHDGSLDPPGGSLGREAQTGKLNGILYEDAAFPYYLEALSPQMRMVIPPFLRMSFAGAF